MTRFKRIRPSPSYSIAVPEQIQEKGDDRVTSLWIEGRQLLLQLSSYLRTEGEQITAERRLRERMEKHPADWKIRSDGSHPDSSIDQTSAECLDEQGVLWIHTYLIWPHLTVYALVSGPESEMRDPQNWATAAVRTIEVAFH